MTGRRLLEQFIGGTDAGNLPPLRVRIFRSICATTAGLSLFVAMPMNLFQNIPFAVHLVTVLIGISGILFAWLSHRGRNFFSTFVVATILMLDVMWFWNAGSRGSITYFFLPVLVFSLALFPGRIGALLLALQLGNIAALFTLEHVFPAWVTPFQSESDRVLDLATSVFAACLATALIATIILSAYREERLRLAESADKLKSSEERHRVIFNATSDAMFVHDINGRLVEVNDRACALFGFTRETALHCGVNEISLGESPYSDKEAAEKLALAASGVPQVFEWHSRRSNGELFWSEVTLRLGTISGERTIIAAVRDISARKQAQQELISSEERLRLAMFATQQGWFEVDLLTGVGVSSPEYIQLIGHDPAHFTTTVQTWLESIHPEDRAAAQREFRACVDSGETRTMEYRRRTAAGDWKWFRSVGRVVERDATGRPLRMMGTHADITDRKELQQQLLHSQRLEAVGTLASGVAHDLNNTLTPMLMAAGFLRERLSDPDDRELMTLIEEGGKRSASVVKQLLAFSRSIATERRAVDPATIVQEIATIMRSTLPREIAIVLNTPGCTLEVEGDATQLHQVLMNLCVNARDAMPQGGTLTLGLEASVLPSPRGTGRGGADSGPHVVLTVSDTGHGIPHEIREKIFDPFFTTKEPGKGTGLGLASVHGIVSAHGGFVHVESEPGRGATFRVVLPGRRPTATATSTSGPSDVAAPASRKACILVVDDEPSVLKTTIRLLASRGYDTLGASSGPEALEILGRQRERIDLVITDFMMPEMDAVALLPLMRQIVPKLKVIGVSGLDQRARSAGLGFSELLCKPYDTSTLIPIVDRVLAEN